MNGFLTLAIYAPWIMGFADAIAWGSTGKQISNCDWGSWTGVMLILAPYVETCLLVWIAASEKGNRESHTDDENDSEQPLE